MKITRDARGRFTSWHKVRAYKRREKKAVTITTGEPFNWREYLTSFPFESKKKVSVYGPAYVNGISEERRYQFFSNNGKSLYRAVRRAWVHPPNKRIVRVRAEEFLAHPHLYESGGHWVDKEVES